MDQRDIDMDFWAIAVMLGAMAERTKARRKAGGVARPRRGGKRRDATGGVPFETPPTSDAGMQRGYGDCYRWDLTTEEYDRWMQSDWPALGGLRVFNAGIFVEARGHYRERSDLGEGIVIYCTAGKGHYRQDAREWEIEAGDLLYCPPLSHHRYWADAERPWTIYWMHLSGDLLPQYEGLLGLTKGGPVRHIGLHQDIVADFTRLAITHIPSSAKDSEFFCLQANALSILGRIATLPHNMAEISGAYGPIQRAISVMNASLDQAFSVSRFAREAGFSRRHFTRQFRCVTGLTPGEWFIRQKMRRARSLLSLPQVLVKEVATRLGYDDALYFSRVFKETVGLSPGAYQRKSLGTHGLGIRREGPA
jgi:AraC-like DNA-binding protein